MQVIATDAPALPTSLQLIDLWLGLGLGIASAAAVVLGLRAWWRRTMGRRFVLYRQLRQVVTGGQMRHVEAMFGPPQFSEEAHFFVTEQGVHRIVKVHSWVSQDHVLRCWEADSLIRSWLVTSRTRRFRPEWRVGNLHIRLHKTKLAEVGNGYERNNIMVGANWFGYAEEAGGGRSQWYQNVFIGVSEEGLRRHYPDLFHVLARPEAMDADHTRAAQARHQSAFDTISVHLSRPLEPLQLPLSASELGRLQTDAGVMGRWWESRMARRRRRLFERELKAQLSVGRSDRYPGAHRRDHRRRHNMRDPFLAH